MRHLLLALFLLLPACAHTTVPADGREATSHTGAPLFSPPLAPERLAALQQRLAEDRQRFAADPSETNAITVGKRCAALGRYHDAIDAYTDGLTHNPTSHRLLRHRGHRHLTVRQFPQAIADLSRAWDLAQRVPDAPESEGGRATDRTAITYHLGLAHYLAGDFAAANRAFSLRAGLPNLNDDNLVGAMHWHYWALRRLNRNAEAAALLTPIREDMDVQDNKSYYTLSKMYKRLVTPAEVEAAMTEKDKLNPGLAYGLALWKRYQLHDPAAANALLRRNAADDNWPAFGHIAAEADLARATR